MSAKVTFTLDQRRIRRENGQHRAGSVDAPGCVSNCHFCSWHPSHGRGDFNFGPFGSLAQLLPPEFAFLAGQHRTLCDCQDVGRIIRCVQRTSVKVTIGGLRRLR